jgi:hypothetical protein
MSEAPEKKDVLQGTLALMVVLLKLGRRQLQAEKHDCDQTAAIISRFFAVRVEELK